MIAMSKDLFGQCVKEFNFKEIFNYFGWNNARIEFPFIEVEGQVFQFKSIAEKSGFRVVQCFPMGNISIPGRNIRNRIESAFSQMSHDHIIIFTDAKKQVQIWQFVYRTLAQGTKRIEVEYDIRMNPEKIYERAAGLVFGLDEEDHVTIIDVIERVKGSLSVNSERVTKRFYDHFKAQRKAMVEGMTGIDEQFDKEWYASLMINRLMFCYFIQKRRFLNNDMNYLNNKLKECQAHNTNNFFSFYKSFLLVLFHDGLASRDHSPELIKEIGIVPYLNGGLFDFHELERKYPCVAIPDKVFEDLFEFFDTWDWHLDSNGSSFSAAEINPDILGYIFEKYINDRAKLGAYYTKEDITEYMARISIIPALLDKVKSVYPLPFEKSGGFWDFIRTSGDKYVYDPVKYGVNSESFTPPAADTYTQAAPNSVNIGRENNLDVVERRAHYLELLSDITEGKIISTEQLVAQNVDICSLLYDYINSTDDYGFIYRFYEVLKSVSVVDPACGSGAFLLAAMNILEPLYEACLSKLEHIAETSNMESSFAYALMEITLYKNVPDTTFWIYKQILENNIYGVDIIAEAVETAKLRLFLKLMSCVEPDYSKPNMGIEPLPDLDHNLRSGNSLIGFVSLQEIVAKAQESNKMHVLQGEIADATIKVRDLKQLLGQFKLSQHQTPHETSIRETLRSQIEQTRGAVTSKLNRIMYAICGTGNFENWAQKFRPFHWFAEFNPIIEDRKGFDVILGNPPYVKNSETTRVYPLSGFTTEKCGNLYTCFIERGTAIANEDASLSMIVQLPIVCTDGMQSVRNHLFDNYNTLAFASFDDRPGKLFEELQHIRVAIITAKKRGAKAMYTTAFRRWYSETRPNLFKCIKYYCWDKNRVSGSIAKVEDRTLDGILKKLNAFPHKVSNELVSRKTYPVFYHNAPLYWIRGSHFAPYFYNEREGEKTSSQYKAIYLSNEKTYNLTLAILNSSLFYLWFVVYGDMRHLNLREIKSFPVFDISDATNQKLKELLQQLMDDHEKHKTRKECLYANTGLVIYDEYHPKASKPFMDLLDIELAKCYGLTSEELQYVINYDIKFRTGGASTDCDN